MVLKTIYFPCNCSVEPPQAQIAEANYENKRIPTDGMVTMIDLGATECIPCKMMAPIIAELEKEYAGRADIIFIDVWKDPTQAKKYGIRAIPTQIFFDAAGKEVHRNVGFMDKKRIVAVLTRLGVS
ncbi:MAG: thioredoxin fold domain-containing protein [Desulfosarcina sp.]|nr:thioredoxin fold domain-containing protein [Desulfosarcina sp.]